MSSVVEVWQAHPGRNLDGALTVATIAGPVTIGHIADDPAGGGAVLVWAGRWEGRPRLRVTGLDEVADPIGRVAAMLAGAAERGTR